MASFVRIELKDGLGNQLWRIAAAAHLAMQFEPHAVVVLYEITPSKHCTSDFWRSSSYASLVRSLIKVEAVMTGEVFTLYKRTSRETPWVVKVPANHHLVTMPATHWDTDVSHDTYHSFKKPEQPRDGEVVVYQLSGCYQRVSVLPSPKCLRKLFTFDSVPETHPSYRSDTAHETTWVVHMRYGDYVRMLDYFPPDPTAGKVCDDHRRMIEFIQRQVAWVVTHLKVEKIYIFSDAMEKATQDLRSALSHCGDLGKSITLHEMHTTHEVEALCLMRYARNLIISASSFSWWAARLGRARKIILPYPWLRCFEKQVSMIPCTPYDAHYKIEWIPRLQIIPYMENRYKRLPRGYKQFVYDPFNVGNAPQETPSLELAQVQLDIEATRALVLLPV
jgi:hypothetical protein